MKEQVQVTGVRKWFGDDYINLQNESHNAVIALIASYGNCILSGCGTTLNGDGSVTVADGYVYLLDSNGINGKICRVYGKTYPNDSFEEYLVQDVKDKDDVPGYGRLYKDGQNKNIILEYYAKFDSVQPAHTNFLTIQAGGVEKNFRSQMQTSSFRFVTDIEKATWNAKYDASDMVSTNTASKGVKRDASGNFSAGTITVTDIIIS